MMVSAGAFMIVAALTVSPVMLAASCRACYRF
jgi:hypothetical protein